MAEETVPPSSTIPPESSAPETETSQQENGPKPADVNMGEHKPEPTNEGAEQSGEVQGTPSESWMIFLLG